MKDGIINVYKPAGMTSNDVIYKVRAALGIKKLGHTGTLDLLSGINPEESFVIASDHFYQFVRADYTFRNTGCLIIGQ